MRIQAVPRSYDIFKTPRVDSFGYVLLYTAIDGVVADAQRLRFLSSCLIGFIGSGFGLGLRGIGCGVWGFGSRLVVVGFGFCPGPALFDNCIGRRRNVDGGVLAGCCFGLLGLGRGRMRLWRSRDWVHPGLVVWGLSGLWAPGGWAWDSSRGSLCDGESDQPALNSHYCAGSDPCFNLRV